MGHEQDPFQPDRHETRRSFDLAASARMMRADLLQFGYVLPETRERVVDEELSYVVEGVDRAAQTTFTFEAGDDDLHYRRNGRPHSYVAMLREGLQVAQAEAGQDSRKQFLAEDAHRDLHIHARNMLRLQPGEQYVWDSPYRHDIEAKYGARFMESCGRFPERQMGFIYRAHRSENGSITLESQTVDRSDEDAFESVRFAAQSDPNISMEALRSAYDTALEHKSGYTQRYHAGRTDSERRTNAWDDILAQGDLIEHFLTKIEQLAADEQLQGTVLTSAAEKLTYGFWASFKRRLDGETGGKFDTARFAESSMPRTVQYALLEQEVAAAYSSYAAAGKILIGCGGAISVSQETEREAAEETFDGIFGKKDETGPSDDCEFTSKECPVCHTKNVKTKVTKTQISGSCGCKVKRAPK